jgi:GNAT superfamily N-acetyltransferase
MGRIIHECSFQSTIPKWLFVPTHNDFDAVTRLWRAARELAFPDFQRRGVGRALLDHARGLSPEHLWLYTFQVNAIGRVFYEQNGFVALRFGVSPAPESEPDVEYHWPSLTSPS